MTLGMILRNKKLKYENVKIGAQSSFFYCGNREEALKLIPRLDEGNQKFIAKCYKALLEEISKKDFKDKPLKQQNETITKKDAYLKWYLHYVDLLQREVRETYESIDEENCLIILVEGMEMGKFSSIKEMQEAKNKKGIKGI